MSSAEALERGLFSMRHREEAQKPLETMRPDVSRPRRHAMNCRISAGLGSQTRILPQLRSVWHAKLRPSCSTCAVLSLEEDVSFAAARRCTSDLFLDTDSTPQHCACQKPGSADQMGLSIATAKFRSARAPGIPTPRERKWEAQESRSWRPPWQPHRAAPQWS